MKWTELRARLRAQARRGWAVIADGVPLRWPHRMWLASIFIIGIVYCYAFPPFQTNDEDAHWLHLWGVAYGHAGCNGRKPNAVREFLDVVRQRMVREDPGQWRAQYLHDALRFVGSAEPTTADGTACRYPPHPYVVPGLVARFVAFGWRGHLSAGSVIRAAYAARITNWILVTLGILLLCRRLPWIRNFALAFYSIPELIQQSMAVNTDSFLFVATVLLLLLVLGRRVSWWNLILVGLVAALMTTIKPVYVTFGAFGIIGWQRLFARHRWRYRDLLALVAAFALPLLVHWLWMRWLGAVAAGEPSRPDRGRVWAQQQIQFLHDHPHMIVTLLAHQWRDFFGQDLMKGSWLSILGAFGWSMFTMKRAGHYLLLFALGCAIANDLVAGQSARELEPPSRRMVLAVGLTSLAVLVTVLAIIVGMYVYFSGAFLGRIGADEVIGVQGRYYLIPILLWTTFLIYVARRRALLPLRWASVPDVLTSASLLTCVWANVYALREILYRFNSAYLPFPIPAPPHY
jgi:uncharacterized membrane protein